MHITKDIIRSVKVETSPRLLQVLGMFDVDPLPDSTQSWKVDLHLPDRWNIGVIVGPSGSGKSTIARELFGACLAGDFAWPSQRSIIDAFPLSITVRQIVGLLSSVGFSSPPAWVRPFACLSNGQQFRVSLARTLAEAMVDGQMKVVDEYSSVVDRTVARIGSAAVAKTVRKHQLQFIAVTCHYDVLDWLEPDWVYDASTGGTLVVENRGSKVPDDASSGDAGSSVVDPQSPSPDREALWRSSQQPRYQWQRPRIDMEIIRADRSAWPLFKPHHYLSGALNPSAGCYVGLVENKPAAFTAVLPFPHPTHSGWREHRTVCLPDFQGVGIGNAMSEFVASLYKATGKPYTSTTSHPAMIYHRQRSPVWRMTRQPGLTGGGSKRFSMMRKTAAIDRLTAGFAHVGPIRPDEAKHFGLNAPKSPNLV